MGGKIQRGEYGLWFKIKGPRGPIRTEKWYQIRLDREREFASLPGQHGEKLIGYGRLGKK